MRASASNMHGLEMIGLCGMGSDVYDLKSAGVFSPARLVGALGGNGRLSDSQDSQRPVRPASMSEWGLV